MIQLCTLHDGLHRLFFEHKSAMIEDSLFRLNVPGRSSLRDDSPVREDEDGDNHDEIARDGHFDAKTGTTHCLDLEGLETVSARLISAFISYPHWLVIVFACTLSHLMFRRIKLESLKSEKEGIRLG